MTKTLKDLTKHTLANRLLVASVSTALLLGALPAHANNPAPTLKADAPNRYVVKKGDTLWDISGRYLKSPEQWRKIWAANKQVKNPHLIYPGDTLLMCIIKGKTLIGIDTGEGCAGIERDIEQKSAPVMAQTVTITPLENSIPPIPLSAIESWISKMLIVNSNDFETTPYILASKKGNLVTTVGDTVYAKGVPLILGQTYGVYHEGQPYVDPKTKNVIGLEVQQVATGRVTKVATNGVSSIELVKSYGAEVREGDRVFVELNNDVAPVFYPKPANVTRGGQIVRVMNSINSAAKGSIVAINLGFENGAAAGDVLTVSQRGALVRDIRDEDAPVRLPSEDTGHIMIFKTFDKISYAYVLDSESPLNIGDRLLPPSSM